MKKFIKPEAGDLWWYCGGSKYSKGIHSYDVFIIVRIDERFADLCSFTGHFTPYYEIDWFERSYWKKLS